MDVREKLVELLDTSCGYVEEVKAENEYHRLSCWNTDVCDTDTMRKYLIGCRSQHNGGEVK